MNPATARSKKDVFLLAACQALFMTSTSAVLTFAAVVGKVLAEYDGQATWPVAVQFASMMATTYFASQLMRRIGRRAGFTFGCLIGISAGLTATYAIFSLDFWLFCAGMALLGSFNAFSHYFRFAAAELSAPEFRSRAVAYVLAGGVVAAIAGPTLAGATRDLFAPVMYAGIFTAIIGLHLTIIAIVPWVKFIPPLQAGAGAAGRPLARIVTQPKCVVAILGAVIGYLVMSFLMTITPLAMVQCGLGVGAIPVVISAHVVGMYLPSFFTGHLIARFGVARVMMAGAFLQALCVAVNVAGIDLGNFLAALFLVGVGWNFLFIGGTTLLTECYEPEEKAKVQGFNDLCIWGTVTAGAIVSGSAIHELGWVMVNFVISPMILVTLGALLWLRFAPGTRPAASGAS